MLPQTVAIDLKRLFVPVFFIPKSPETAQKRKEIFKMTETEKMTKVERKAEKAGAKSSGSSQVYDGQLCTEILSRGT